jgi:flagellar biosynthetic protein FlhB
MANDQPAGEKTEKPTPKRLREARDRGQVARSPDLSAWVGILATVLLLQITVHRGSAVMHDVLQRMGLAIAHPEAGVALRLSG